VCGFASDFPDISVAGLILISSDQGAVLDYTDGPCGACGVLPAFIQGYSYCGGGQRLPLKALRRYLADGVLAFDIHVKWLTPR
jgi:hypothetical protein